MASILIRPLKSCSKKEGYKVLATRQWPAGVAKGAIDCWVKGLAPPPSFLKHHSCGLSPAAFEIIYKGYLSRPAAQNLLKTLALLSLKRHIILLCVCPHGKISTYCHEAILAQALRQRRKKKLFKPEQGIG